MRRLVGAIAGLVLAWFLGVGGAASMTTLQPGPHAYAYDADKAPNAVAADSLDRGPLATRYDGAATLAVGEQSHGISPQPEVAARTAYTSYDSPTPLAHVNGRTSTTRRSSQAVDGNPHSVGPAGVAANIGSRLAEASSSAFRAADNVGDWTGNA